MSVVRRLPMLLLPLAVIAGCSGSGGHSPAATGARPASQRAGGSGWTAQLDAVESPQPTLHGFAFHTLGPQGAFRVAAVDATAGHLLWSADASPSLTAPGVAQSLLVVNGGKTVVWLSPGNSAQNGDVSITAADAMTGRFEWSYGAGSYLTSSPPSACHGGTQICAVGMAEGASEVSVVALDARDGHVVSSQDMPNVTTARELGPSPDPGTIGLLDTVGSLAAVDYDGRMLWTKADADVFGGLRVSPNDGWDIGSSGGHFIGNLGYEGAADQGPQSTTFTTAHEPGVTAAFDITTGKTLWVRPDTAVDCGSLTFNAAHPVLCTGSYTLDLTNASQSKVLSSDITLEGIDPSTGKSRWTWHAGNLPGLVVPSGDIVQDDDTHFTVRTGATLTTIDLDHGPARTANHTAGWCESSRNVQTSLTIFKTEDPDGTYRGWAISPCSADGKALASPATTPSFAGGKADGMFAWTDNAGTVRAVRSR